MSVNRNSNIIKAIKGQERDPIRYNFSASLWAIGGGGGGATGSVPVSPSTAGNGGGGGAGAVVSSSISIVPNITWHIEVGGSGSINQDGGDTYAIAYNNDYNGLVTFRAQGGRKGEVWDVNNGAGGNTGTGSLEINATTQSYDARLGYATASNNGGGGAGANGDGGFNNNPSVGGLGLYAGITGSIIPIYGEAAGGGGGGVYDSALSNGQHGGGNGGRNGEAPTSATKIGAGGGGGSRWNPGEGGDGYKGGFFIAFTGQVGTNLYQYDITASNASISYDEPTNTTLILFDSGSGTFRYNAPFPYDKRP